MKTQKPFCHLHVAEASATVAWGPSLLAWTKCFIVLWWGLNPLWENAVPTLGSAGLKCGDIISFLALALVCVQQILDRDLGSRGK